MNTSSSFQASSTFGAASSTDLRCWPSFWIAISTICDWVAIA